MASEHSPAHTGVTSNGSATATKPLGTFQYAISRLKIGTKIGLGYTIVLGVAAIGTFAGVVLGHHYQQQAIHLSKHTEDELQLLYRLQTGILLSRTHQQQFIPLLAHPNDLKQEYSHFLAHENEVRATWAELKTFATAESHHIEAHSDVIPTFLDNHTDELETYFQQVERLMGQVYWLTLNPERNDEVERYENMLFSFTNSATALKFDEISSSLAGIIQSSHEEHEIAQAYLLQSEQLRTRIVLSSMFLSVAIAIIVAIYTGRAIARPLVAVTKVAEQVSQTSDFNLQAPVTTADEVGSLAISLNQLVCRVKALMAEQKAEASRQLIQSEKMSSLGRMLAGVAHEINNPINFICGNLNYADIYVRDLLTLLDTYQTELPEVPVAVQTKAEEIELDFLKEDLPRILQSMQIGTDRARQIALSLKDFARLDKDTAHSIDLHTCLDSTLLILNNRLKKGINLVRNYGTIPTIEGYAGSLYQVFMNVLSNAIEAFDEQMEQQGLLEIVVTTQSLSPDEVLIQIADNGPGIALEHQAKIFDTFYTTKPRGVGTGLGLSISRQIVEDKHQGRMTFESELGKGTRFSIVLPVCQRHQPVAPLRVPTLTERAV